MRVAKEGRKCPEQAPWHGLGWAVGSGSEVSLQGQKLSVTLDQGLEGRKLTVKLDEGLKDRKLSVKLEEGLEGQVSTF